MSLKNLIEDQTIIIDDHNRGNEEVKDWDRLDIDVHIDKKTNFRYEGKYQEIRLRIPINSDLPINIENGRKQVLEDVPSHLKREIQKALKNKAVREAFMKDVVDVLKNFKTTLKNKDRTQQILKRLARHFDLTWTEKEIATYTNDVLTSLTQFYSDKHGLKYFLSIDRRALHIGRNNGRARIRNSLR